MDFFLKRAWRTVFDRGQGNCGIQHCGEAVHEGHHRNSACKHRAEIRCCLQYSVHEANKSSAYLQKKDGHRRVWEQCSKSRQSATHRPRLQRCTGCSEEEQDIIERWLFILASAVLLLNQRKTCRSESVTPSTIKCSAQATKSFQVLALLSVRPFSYLVLGGGGGSRS